MSIIDELIVKGVVLLFLSGLFAILTLLSYFKGSMFFVVLDLAFCGFYFMYAVSYLILMHEETNK